VHSTVHHKWLGHTYVLMLMLAPGCGERDDTPDTMDMAQGDMDAPREGELTVTLPDGRLERGSTTTLEVSLRSSDFTLAFEPELVRFAAPSSVSPKSTRPKTWAHPTTKRPTSRSPTSAMTWT